MPSNTAPPGNASNLDLAYQVILALPHVKTREDGLALLGVLDRAGGLDQGNLKFRLADIITEKPPGKFLIEFLTERNILLDGEFLKDLVELSIKGRSFGVLKQVVKNPEIKARLESAEFPGLLCRAIKTNSGTQLSSLSALLEMLDFSQAAKDEALAELTLWAKDKLSQDKTHLSFERLIKAGANPATYSIRKEGLAISPAQWIATQASSYPPGGVYFLNALRKSPYWTDVLHDKVGARFVWNWFNSSGDTDALVSTLNETPGLRWWDGDPIGVLDTAFSEALTAESPLFSALKANIKKSPPVNKIAFSRAIDTIEEPVFCAQQFAYRQKSDDEFEDIFSPLRQKGGVDPHIFWKNQATLIAPMFDDQTAWKLLCGKVANFFAHPEEVISEDATASFLEALRLEISTGELRQPAPSRARRI